MRVATPVSSSTSTPRPRSASRSLPGLLVELTKARLCTLVVFSTAVGFVVASPAGIHWPGLMWTALGTALAAAGAGALNQVLEVARDARMHRTRNRPLPSGALSRSHSFVVAVVMSYAGVATLALLVNLVAAGLAMLSILIYTLVYTPLKVRTSFNTLAGAVVGAIPPMIGWVGARGTIDPGAWSLAAILLVWQLPHFMALAWLYRDDYRRGGFAMLPTVDRHGQLTCQVIILTSLALLPIALTATLTGVAGWLYALGSIVLGLFMLALAIRLYRDRTDVNARRVFLCSLVYLPLLLSLMMIDRGPLRGLDMAAMETLAAAAPTE